MSRLQQSLTPELPSETPFFFSNGDNRLFAILHRPGADVALGRGFVFCYPCFEEKLWAHRVFVSLARELAAKGFHVLRFDYQGHGDSDGDFVRTNVSTRLSDVSCAVSWLRSEIGNESGVSLLGLRFGAMLAAMYAENDSRVQSLVLWEPVTDGHAYMQEVLLSNLATQSAVYQEIRQTREDLVAQMQAGGTVVIEGYELSHQFYEEASVLQSSRLGKYPGQCLIVQTGRANQKPKKPLESLSKGYPCAELVLCTEEPFWKELKTYYPRAPQLFTDTFAWIQTHVR